MTLSEIVDKLAREYADGHYPSKVADLSDTIRAALIALLKSDEVGYREALEDLSNESCLCEIDNCIHARAEQKLKELESL